MNVVVRGERLAWLVPSGFWADFTGPVSAFTRHWF
jgi:hypothetical protein